MEETLTNIVSALQTKNKMLEKCAITTPLQHRRGDLTMTNTLPRATASLLNTHKDEFGIVGEAICLTVVRD